jgi:steroid delta-isomerase
VTSAQQIRDTLKRYTELVSAGDWKAISALYADGATVEDPVGTELRRGRDAIEALYREAAGMKLHMQLTGPVCVAGNEGAAPLLITTTRPDGRQAFLDVIDVMSFDERGRITSMRAFWSPEDWRSP